MARTLTIADDIQTLRELAANDAVYRPVDSLLRVCDAADKLLRVLDAFEAMEREKWGLWFWEDYKERTGFDSWSIEPPGGDGPGITEAKSPLEALLAAAATLEGKSDG